MNRYRFGTDNLAAQLEQLAFDPVHPWLGAITLTWKDMTRESPRATLQMDACGWRVFIC